MASLVNKDKETLKKRRNDNRLIFLCKGLKGKSRNMKLIYMVEDTMLASLIVRTRSRFSLTLNTYRLRVTV